MNSTRKFWETCSANYAHLKKNFEISLCGSREIKLSEAFLNDLELENKTVIDYGCGGGYFGLYLLKHKDIDRYIGVDIAERSLENAKNLFIKKGFDNYLLHRAPVEFKDLNSDVLISMACIQHFPNEKYLRLFLENINRSNIKDVVLHIRYAEENKFNDSYEDVDATFQKIKDNNATCNYFGIACLTNPKYVSSILTKYTLVKETEKFGGCKENTDEWKSQYLIYRINDDSISQE